MTPVSPTCSFLVKESIKPWVPWSIRHRLNADKTMKQQLDDVQTLSTVRMGCLNPNCSATTPLADDGQTTRVWFCYRVFFCRAGRVGLSWHHWHHWHRAISLRPNPERRRRVRPAHACMLRGVLQTKALRSGWDTLRNGVSRPGLWMAPQSSQAAILVGLVSHTRAVPKVTPPSLT